MGALARNAHSGVVFSQLVSKQNRQIFSKKDFFAHMRVSFK